MKQLIENIKQQQLSEPEQTDQIKRELLKCEIHKFSITYSKTNSQNTRKSQSELAKKLKELKSKLNSETNFNEYKKCKKDLELIYERIAEGVKIRSKWYEEGKNSTKFFLNIEKKPRSVEALVRKLEVTGKEIRDQAKINDEIKIFFEEAFKFHRDKSATNLSNILKSIDLPCLHNKQKDFCEIKLGEKELYNAMKSISNNKTPGNDGLSREFYEAF